jgi:hypothetical protein
MDVFKKMTQEERRRFFEKYAQLFCERCHGPVPCYCHPQWDE